MNVKMYSYKNPSGGPNWLVLHKSEWNRLKQQAGPPLPPTQPPNEYLNSLIEKSQAWIKTWPDTVQGCVAKLEKQQEKQRTEEIALAKAFAKKKKDNKTTKVAVDKAKQIIFDESCYGKKLISALLESKAQEERDAQIQFKKEIKAKEDELEKKQNKTVNFCSFGLNKDGDTKDNEKKCLAKQNAKKNKEIFEKQKEYEAKTNEQDKLSDLENAQLMKHLLDLEQEAENKIKLLERQSLEEYAAEQKKCKEERLKWEAEYYAKLEQCRKEQDELNLKIKHVLQGINGARESAAKQNIYETIKESQEEERKRYEAFIEKGFKKGEERAAKRDSRLKEKGTKNLTDNMSTAEFNKSLAEYVRQMQCANKCFCDRQCLFVKSEKERNVAKGNVEIEPKATRPPPSFGPCNKLTAALRLREKAPTPWTGSGVCAAPAQFAQQAGDVLRECKYKIPGRKVVDEYRKYNGFDATTLPVPNYN